MFELLILISIFGVYKIISEIIRQKKCPRDQDLKRVILGIEKKNSPLSDQVIMHLGICEKCQQRAKDIGDED